MTFEKTEFKFPDEIEDEKFEIDIVDDTPDEDKNRQAMPKDIVENLEKDELEDYDENVKQKLKQLKKVWHDERREKEQVMREHQEAIAFTKQLYEENQRIKNAYSAGEKEYISTSKQAAKIEQKMARKIYKEAYESGDTKAIILAQEALNLAQLKVLKAEGLQATTLQNEQDSVKSGAQDAAPAKSQAQGQPKSVAPDKKAVAWQQRNEWFGDDEEMTAAALGLHEKLKNSGVEIGSDEYYNTLDKTMRRRFPEQFGVSESKPATVVASATRSTMPTRISLTASQIQLAKRLGVTPEAYAREKMKLEKNHG